MPRNLPFRYQSEQFFDNTSADQYYLHLLQRQALISKKKSAHVDV